MPKFPISHWFAHCSAVPGVNAVACARCSRAPSEDLGFELHNFLGILPINDCHLHFRRVCDACIQLHRPSSRAPGALSQSHAPKLKPPPANLCLLFTSALCAYCTPGPPKPVDCSTGLRSHGPCNPASPQPCSIRFVPSASNKHQRLKHAAACRSMGQHLFLGPVSRGCEACHSMPQHTENWARVSWGKYIGPKYLSHR